MRIGEKQILAWLDGELDDAGAREVEQAVQADAALMARAEAHFLTMMQLKAAFAPLLDAPFPNGPVHAGPAIARGADEDGPALADDPPAVKTKAEPAPSLLSRITALGRPALRRWGLLAAALLIGLLVGRFILGAGPVAETTAASTAAPGPTPAQTADLAPAHGDIVNNRGGSLIAAGALADALENGVEAGPSTTVRVPLSFRDKAGRLCRSFDTARLAGIACRDGDGWRLRLALEPSSGGRSAASESPFVGQAIDAMIAGEPLDAGEARAAAARGWR